MTLDPQGVARWSGACPRCAIGWRGSAASCEPVAMARAARRVRGHPSVPFLTTNTGRPALCRTSLRPPPLSSPDELKNEDIALRMNSLRRLSTIAKALGEERTRKVTTLELVFAFCLFAWPPVRPPGSRSLPPPNDRCLRSLLQRRVGGSSLRVSQPCFALTGEGGGPGPAPRSQKSPADDGPGVTHLLF